MTDDKLIGEPPGTVLLNDLQHATTKEGIILHPTPSSDPNDPLNWSPRRKATNFILALVFVFFTFVLINVIYIPYAVLTAELDFVYETFTTSSAMNFAGLAIGAVFFMPFVHKYGRRPLYLGSLLIQLAAAILLSEMKSRAEMVVGNFLSGLGGGICETLLLVTIVDLYFVHQHATMNAWFVLAQCLGVTIGPMAAGFVVVGQGWRWLWRWITIFIAITLILVLFFFEESKYSSIISGQFSAQNSDTVLAGVAACKDKDGKVETLPMDEHLEDAPEYKPRTYQQRFALYTPSPGLSIVKHFYRPFCLLFTIPAVALTALTYGALVAWYTVLISVVSTNLPNPPYNFSPSGLGLFLIGPFIGTLPGTFVGGILLDKLVVRLSKRNKGVYEPEMRLYFSVPAGIVIVSAIIWVGIGLAHHLHWTFLATGCAIFTFGWAVIGDCALTYLVDCYPDLVGDSQVAVVFIRNATSVGIQFALAPWLAALGIQDLFVCVSMIALAMFIGPVVVFIIWGKKFRAQTADRTNAMGKTQ